MRLAIYQPDIPQNYGSLLRLAACLGLELHVIEPCGFALDEKKIRRVAMDYLDHARIVQHVSWQAFLDWYQKTLPQSRLVLLTTRAEKIYVDFDFTAQDILIVGQESVGVPEEVRKKCDAALRVPMSGGVRSLNVVQAAAMVVGEALRQTGSWAAADVPEV